MMHPDKMRANLERLSERRRIIQAIAGHERLAQSWYPVRICGADLQLPAYQALDMLKSRLAILEEALRLDEIDYAQDDTRPDPQSMGMGSLASDLYALLGRSG